MLRYMWIACLLFSSLQQADTIIQKRTRFLPDAHCTKNCG